MLRSSSIVGSGGEATQPPRNESRQTGRACRGTSVLLTVCLACSGLSGCLVGPDYTTPEAEVPDAWLDLQGQATDSSDTPWWQNFEDPTLDSLVDRAISQNLTLQQAGLRVIQARALRGIAVGQFFPQTQVVAGQASHTWVSENSPQGLGDLSYEDYSIGLEAVWELDFWGKFRRGIESADAALDASVAEYDGVLVLLAADVASTYVGIRSLQEQLAFTRNNVQSQQDTLELTRIRFNAGAVSELDVATAQATLSNTQSFLPQLEDSLRQATLALCVLLGRTPSDLAEEIGD